MSTTFDFSRILPTSISYNNRAGHSKLNMPGTNAAYLSFLPTAANEVEIEYTDELVAALIAARLAVARLEDTLQTLDKEQTEEFIRREALASANLAHPAKTKDFMQDEPDSWFQVAAPEEELSPFEQKLQDYRRDTDADNIEEALHYLSWRLAELPLSRRLVSEAHGIMLKAPWYDKKTPGWFRTSPVWMGKADEGIADASYVAPVPEDLNELWSELERFMNSEDDPRDPLLLAALLHLEFELLRPFLDGNGRVGRALVQLYLQEQGLLSKPALLLSEELLENAYAYYKELFLLEQTGNFERFIIWFLQRIEGAAKRSLTVLP